MRIQPSPFAAVPQPPLALETIPLPQGLPAPVERFYRQVYGERVPLIRTAVISGRGTMRPIGGITFPMRFRFTHEAGRNYRHYIEATVFGLPLMKANEYFVTGKGRLELPWGVEEGAQIDQGANLSLWAETVATLPAVLLSEERVRWEAVDESIALLIVPFGAAEERFVVRFDPATGLPWLLEQMEMAEHAHKQPSAVSGGQQQRVAIACALANDPPILVADEPTGNLDSKSAESVFRMFERLVDQGKTILMVTHDQDLARRVTRTVIIADGEVIDEYLARALPMLSEAQLIWATHNIETRVYPPGQAILQQGMPADNFYLITRGRVEVVLQQPNRSEIVVTTMGVGQYFGEIELLHGGANIATIRAAPDSGVEVVALDRDEFRHLVAESPAAEEAIDRIARERVEENSAARQDEREVMAHA